VYLMQGRMHSAVPLRNISPPFSFLEHTSIPHMASYVLTTNKHTQKQPTTPPKDCSEGILSCMSPCIFFKRTYYY
jgi:hypothetical protein